MVPTLTSPISGIPAAFIHTSAGTWAKCDSIRKPGRWSCHGMSPGPTETNTR